MRVAIADDSALFRHGVAALLNEVGIEVVCLAKDGSELLAHLPAALPDVVILDIRMPPTGTDEGLRTAEAVRRRHPHVGILILSAYNESDLARRIVEEFRSGVGYLLKDRVDDVEALRGALENVRDGRLVVDPDVVVHLMDARRKRVGQLSARQRDVLQHMAQGRSNRGIGHAMGLSERTVEAYVKKIFDSLVLACDGDDNRRVLAVLAWLGKSGTGDG